MSLLASPLRLLASPLRVMERIADAAADYIVPDKVPDAAAAVEENPPPAAAAPPPAAAAPPAAAKRPSKKRSSPTAAAAPKKRVVIKKEAVRDMPFRSTRRKAGFYSEAHLTALAWSGSGSKQDPIRFD